MPTSQMYVETVKLQQHLVWLLVHSAVREQEFAQGMTYAVQKICVQFNLDFERIMAAAIDQLEAQGTI